MRAWMRKLWAGMLAVALLTGCQATPDKPVVIQKDLEQMIEKAVATDGTHQALSLSERLDAPDTYSASLDGYKGELTVNVKAAVTVPDAAGISVVRIGRHVFTQEEADKMMEVFLEGETLYQVDLSMTKEEIQERLVRYYGMRDGAIALDMDGENPADREKLESVIAYYEGLLAAAPDTPA